MRHGKTYNHLGRKSAHRKAMIANMATSLIVHKRIKTTTAKAKALRTFIEPIITRSKNDTTHARRMAFRELGNKNAVTELFREVVEKVGNRPGGYTRIIKTDNRPGDNADMCIMELVDFNEILLTGKEPVKAKVTRRRRGRKKPGAGIEEAQPSETIEELKDESGKQDTLTATDDKPEPAILTPETKTDKQEDDDVKTDTKTGAELSSGKKSKKGLKSGKIKSEAGKNNDQMTDSGKKTKKDKPSEDRKSGKTKHN